MKLELRKKKALTGNLMLFPVRALALVRLD
jgi:hypothetical protein